jgi:hypothetical protein
LGEANNPAGWAQPPGAIFRWKANFLAGKAPALASSLRGGTQLGLAQVQHACVSKSGKPDLDADEAIQGRHVPPLLDCFAALAMTGVPAGMTKSGPEGPLS